MQTTRLDVPSRRSSPYRIVAGFLLVASAWPAHRAAAEGLRLYGMSGEAMSRGEALAASVGDAAAAWYNPAALTRLEGADLSLTLNNLFIRIEHTDRQGRSEKSGRTYFPLFGLYYGVPFGGGNFAAGLGINTPFGLATEYSKTGSFRYITTGGEATVINVNPNVAWRAAPSLSVGAGLDYFVSTVELGQQYPWAAVGTQLGLAGAAAFPDGSAKVEGKGDGFGFNAGLLYEPAPRHALGLTYRSQVAVKYDGEQAEFTNVPAALGGGTYRTGVKTGLRFPDVITAGYAYKPSDEWVWEIGGHWTNWNDFRSVDVTLDRPTALFPDSSTKLDWRNGWAVHTGAEYACSETWSVAGGYMFTKSPVREETYTPLIPDGDHHVVSAGVKYRTGGLTLRLPVVGIFQTGTGSVDSRTADATGTQDADGKYELQGFQLGLGAEYAFGG